MPSRHAWTAAARRRWPVVAFGGVLLVAVVLLSRRGPDGSGLAPAAPALDARAEAVDSVVTLDTTALKLAEIELGHVISTGAEGLVANGTITFDANRVSVVAPRAEGRVTEVLADLGQVVATGAVLARIDSRDVAQTRAELERARASVEVTRSAFERERRLYEQEISSQKDLLEAQGAYKIALAEYQGAVAQLSGLGVETGQGGVFGLTAPLHGTIAERNAMPGQIAGPSTNLFTVADLRRVWITVDVYEGDAPRVRPGAVAEVRPRALPNETFRGRVTYAGGVVDTVSRTMKVRVEVENASLRLRPGMFAQVHLQAPARSDRRAPVLVVPQVAVQDLNGHAVVFVPQGPTGRFVARRVTVGAGAGSGLVAITIGLHAGEAIVTKGAFQLKAELTKSSFGEKE